MNIIEYIEQQHQLVLSNEVQDYLSNLKDYEGHIMPYVYKNLAILKGCGKCKVFTSIEYPNTFDWVELNSIFAIIYTHHFFTRYRNRIWKKIPGQNLNIRCNKTDQLLDVIRTLWSIDETYLAVCNEDEDGFLNKKKQPFYLCEDGLIPITVISPTILRCDTFLSADILSKEQGRFWYNVYNDICQRKK